MVASNASSSTTAASPEERIAALESLLFGLRHDPPSGGDNPSPSRPQYEDIDAALSRLASDSKLSTPKALADDWNVCVRLEAELHPGSMLTHQGTGGAGLGGPESVKPLLYRREEVLASADSLRRAMDQLAEVKDLLLLSYTSADSSSSPSPSSSAAAATADHTSAAILSSDRYQFANLPTVRRRLDDAADRISTVLERGERAAARVDALVGRYHRVVSAASEKMVLADEEVSRLEQERERDRIER